MVASFAYTLTSNSLVTTPFPPAMSPVIFSFSICYSTVMVLGDGGNMYLPCCIRKVVFFTIALQITVKEKGLLKL
jgi:hypothetical protein